MIEQLGSIIITFIQTTGYLGVFFLMVIESALIPVPSEVTMPFAGSLVAMGKMNIVLVVAMGTLGNLAGSLAAYYLGYYKGDEVVRILIRRWGKYLLIREKEYDHAEKWFRKYGEPIVFFSRLLPAIRTFISLPAGIARMNIRKFIVYTTIGSFLWSWILTYVGIILGNNWSSIGPLFHKFDIVIAVIGLTVALFYILHRLDRLPRIFRS